MFDCCHAAVNLHYNKLQHYSVFMKLTLVSMARMMVTSHFAVKFISKILPRGCLEAMDFQLLQLQRCTDDKDNYNTMGSCTLPSNAIICLTRDSYECPLHSLVPPPGSTFVVISTNAIQDYDPVFILMLTSHIPNQMNMARWTNL